METLSEAIEKSKELLKPEQRIRQELEKAKLADTAIAEMKERYMPLTVQGLEDKEGLEKVHRARIEVKKARTGVQKYCKQAREAANAYQKAVIAEEKRIVGLIEPIEAHLEEQESIVEKERERIRLEEEAKEKERVRARIKRLLDLGLKYDGINYSSGDLTISAEQVVLMIDERFDSFISKAEEAFKAEQERLLQEEIAKEAERKRLADIAEQQAAEAKRLEAIRKEQEEKEAAMRAEQEKKEAELRAEREKIDAEKKAIEDVKRKAEEEKQRAIELEAAKKEAAERAVREAEEKAKREAEAKAEAERKAKEENARQEALKPDKDKLLVFAQHLNGILYPGVKSSEAQDILENAKSAMQEIISTIIIQTKTL